MISSYQPIVSAYKFYVTLNRSVSSDHEVQTSGLNAVLVPDFTGFLPKAKVEFSQTIRSETVKKSPQLSHREYFSLQRLLLASLFPRWEEETTSVLTEGHCQAMISS